MPSNGGSNYTDRLFKIYIYSILDKTDHFIYFFPLFQASRGGSPLSPFLDPLGSPPPAHMGSLGSLSRPSLYPIPSQYPYPTIGNSNIILITNNKFYKLDKKYH